MTKDIKKKLQEWAKTYHCADFIQNDPVQFPHRYRQNIPFCVLKECIVGASIARPCPFVLQENCPGKCVAAPSRRATNGRPYTCNGQEGVGGPRGGSPGHPLQECGAQFSVTVMVPILVLSAVVLPNAPLRESAAVPLGASSTAVPTAVRKSSRALSKLPLMPSKPASAA